MSTKRKLYSLQEKEKAVKLADKIGAIKAAEKIGVAFQTIYAWRSQMIKKAEAVTKDMPKQEKPVTIQEPTEYLRGQIYFIHEAPTIGSEQHSGRPAVIVSNNQLNKNLNTVEIVYLTTSIKHLGPEATIIKSSGCTARVVCSNITTIDKSRIGGYKGECTPDEMSRIDRCLLASLNMEKYVSPQIADDQIIARIQGIKAERDAYSDMYTRLFERFIQECRKK